MTPLQVAVPPGFPYVPLEKDVAGMPTAPAREYKFVLDPFQRQAIRCLERTEVLYQCLQNVAFCLLNVRTMSCS